MAEINGYDATARAGKLLHGLGFGAETHQRAVSEFSGGWRVRLNLARALMMPSDMLLLDEPTNHLDLDAVLWLEQWLLKYPGMLMMISHDREFLDGVGTHMLHLHEGTAKLYSGDYTSFERQRSEQLRQQQIAFEKEQAERAHLQSFIDRFKASAAKAKQAQSRVKRLAKLAGTEAVRAEREIRINFADPPKLPNSLTRLNHVDAGYGDIKILGKVGFGLEAGDRIGLLGPNGAGKSTLVKPWSANCRFWLASAPRIRTWSLATLPSTRWNPCTRGRRPSITCARLHPGPACRTSAISSAAGIFPATAPSKWLMDSPVANAHAWRWP
jgi:ATP-binding cassette subfamily F protein 3